MAGLEQISAVLLQRSLLRARSEISVTSGLAYAPGIGVLISTARSSPAGLTSVRLRDHDALCLCGHAGTAASPDGAAHPTGSGRSQKQSRLMSGRLPGSSHGV